ncbi:unnamed protein product [Ceutorhynchus assimilis]|uniref:Cadherin domain-containing protein n=1 Tax=Ceutorhynchus assimilis TaxID=467358 RepID=A0A9N9MP91_9CUCU|nr:unnamed protein product [Ceutorhynchus assimilis]
MELTDSGGIWFKRLFKYTLDLVSFNGVIKTTAILDIETKTHYWLTVFAQDHGVVPLFSSVEIYIEVLNENDNVPLSELPVYYPVIQEDSPAGTVVLQIKATDRDKEPGQEISYKIAAGNQWGFFAINASTGKKTDLLSSAEASQKPAVSFPESQVLEEFVKSYQWSNLNQLSQVMCLYSIFLLNHVNFCESVKN